MYDKKLAAVAAFLLGALIAACGSSSTSSSGTAASKSSTGSSAPTAASSSGNSAPIALITTKQDKLGTILAYGPKKLTVYLFEADKGNASRCSSECARIWPAVTGNPQARGQAVTADLGTIKRSDGTTQVTYKRHPLYLYAKDQDVRDTYGQGIKGFGAQWYAVAPSGNKVDTS